MTYLAEDQWQLFPVLTLVIEGSNSERVLQLVGLVVKLGSFDLIMQKQLFCLFLVNQIQFFRICNLSGSEYFCKGYKA